MRLADRLRTFIAGTALCLAAGYTHAIDGVTDDRVLLGQSAAFSGPAQALGKEMLQGAKVYFDGVNAHGGVHGRRIEIASLDDGYEPDRAAANTRELIDQRKVFALFGYVGTPTSLAAMPIFTAAKVPFVGAFTGAEALRNPLNPQIFNVRASYFDETERIVEHLVTTGVTRIAVFHQNDSYGKAGLTGVERALKKRGLTPLATATVERNSVDVAAAVATLSAAMPDAVVQISAYASCAALIKEMRKAGSIAMFYNVSFVGSSALAQALGNEARGVVISQVVPLPWSGIDPIVREYQGQMQSAGFTEFSFTSLEGFIAAKVMAEGLQRAGRNLSRARLIEAFESMGRLDLGGFHVGFSPEDHNGSEFVDLTIISRDGRFIH
ncbi:MAG: ABC transporter substrate-binding protein [Zoogloeaceae bacterium]|nr:ABC transporter substrate-binding protein [Rhodocyclaceae bacterium]MCP5234256.1 ABC transporter substrate-binding protein [Zoogloeaceae bacterium]